jgi:V/A-type H+-transporting ATPase subunit E
MNGIENIIRRIEEDCAKELEAIRKASEEECAEISRKYKRQAEDEYSKIVEAGRTQAAQRRERILSSAAMDAKKQVLAEKQAIISKAFSRAREMILGLGDSEYLDFLGSLAASASTTGRELIVLSPKDASKYGEKVVSAANELLKQRGKTAQLSLSSETRNIPGGLILLNGRVEANCSVDILVELYRSELTSRLAGALFN